jgi:oligopeptide/dipeptide ABC transporter ATP-binding protein
MRIGEQIAEPIRLHTGAGRQSAWAQADRLLDEVGIAEPALRARQYPHQFSGGMRQRAMIALALACSPALLIADEPTTGLDADLKLQILDLLARLRRERHMAVLLVSHDLALVRRHADSVHVLYAGRTMERGPAGALFVSPRHPYTLALLQAAPVPGQAPVAIPGVLPEPEALPPGCRFAPRCRVAAPDCDRSLPPLAQGATDAACLYPLARTVPSGGGRVQVEPAAIGPPLLRVDAVAVRYRTGFVGAATLHTAIEAATLSLAEGECLALVGASGSGKTSLGRAILQMLPYEGRITLRGALLGALRGNARRASRRRLGAVFQDPCGSLNPTMTVAAAIGEALRLGGERSAATRRRRAAELLGSVGLPTTLLDCLPSSLSGGQAQRVAIARALAAEPDLLVLDEPTSSLDVSSQAVVLSLLQQLATSRGLSCILITHDLDAVSFLVHRVLRVSNARVLEAGKNGLL